MSDGRAIHLIRRRGAERPTTMCGFYWANRVLTTKERESATCKRCLKKAGQS